MVQCEMCGTETASPKTIKVEGAELDVCESCTSFGTEVRTESSSSTSTKYSTGSSGGSGGSSGSSSSSRSGGSSGGRRRSDMFDDMDELAQDYDQRVRSARESKGLSQAELANELNEKASLVRKIERGDTLPSDEIQRKLERFLGVDLSAGGDVDQEWSGGGDAGTTTLGDVVERKD